MADIIYGAFVRALEKRLEAGIRHRGGVRRLVGATPARRKL